jgi:hypothetical protein
MKTQIRFLTVISMFFLIIGSANSQVLELNSLSITERGYEPVEIKMETSYFDLLFQQSIPTNRLFLYAYHSGTGWVPIPFQIDENDAFKPSNNHTDDSDILIFLAQDLGDRVTLGNWIDNLDSKSYKRYEIEIVDPNNSEKKGWCYLFVSSSLTEQDKSSVKYISYDKNTDIVNSKYYQLDYGKKWYPSNISVTPDGGGTSQDFYDRTKIRFIMIFGGTLWTTLLEDDLQVPPDSTIKYSANSVVRLKRKAPLKLYLFGAPASEVKFSMTYYPYSSLFSGQVGLDQFIGIAAVKSIRMSYDLNPSANNMKFFSGDSNGIKNQNILINAAGNLDNVDTTLQKNKNNWTMATGTPGTMLTINDVLYESNPSAVPPEPFDQYMYYWDDKTGKSLSLRTIDPINDFDTFDRNDSLASFGSYGDHGMAFESYALTDSFHYNSMTYFLKSNLPPDKAQLIFENLNNLLLRYVRAQDYLTSVENITENGLPTEYRLRPNFPNPFNPGTTITFDLPKDDRVTLQIFDIQGREIITLIDKNLKAGVHNFIWNGRDVNNNLMSSGIYICAIKTNVFSASQKMAFVK